MRAHKLQETLGTAAKSTEQSIPSRLVRHAVEVRHVIRRTEDPALQRTLQQLLKQCMIAYHA
ncbi:MAG: hypothetical protein HYZ91_05290 [Candidatus Omnitrophica bacterium]|nr:hypothetical protein [Candidatus Omnitrophota bacterium]